MAATTKKILNGALSTKTQEKAKTQTHAQTQAKSKTQASKITTSNNDEVEILLAFGSYRSVSTLDVQIDMKAHMGQGISKNKLNAPWPNGQVPMLLKSRSPPNGTTNWGCTK